MNKIFAAIISLVLFSCSAPEQSEILIKELNYPTDLKVVTRAEWGSVPLTKTLPQHEINKINIHHSGVEFTERDLNNRLYM